jgi:hypothetical protein
MPDPVEHLDEQERQLWADYAGQDAAGLRKDALATLREFIASVRTYPPGRRAAWVEAICAEHWSVPAFPGNEGKLRLLEGKLRLRYPLRVELILPELLEGYRVQRANYARWLALFSLTPWGGIDAQIHRELQLHGLPEWYPPQLLREALALDAADTQAAHALLLHLDHKFWYWTHHVPDFVLTDDTATMRRELDEFERLAERYPTGLDYAFEVSGWRLHCEAWEEFLERRDEFDCYADFLAQKTSS